MTFLLCTTRERGLHTLDFQLLSICKGMFREQQAL